MAEQVENKVSSVEFRQVNTVEEFEDPETSQTKQITKKKVKV